MIPTEAHAAAVEAICRWMCENAGCDPDEIVDQGKSAPTLGPQWKLWDEDAKAVMAIHIATMERQGFVMVPVEATREMMQAALERPVVRPGTKFAGEIYATIYRAMVAARPKVE